MRYASGRSGFVLPELIMCAGVLLVFVVSFLVPAMSRARGEARLSIDANSMRMHAIGTAVFAAHGDDRMPHAPFVPGGLDARYGEAGRLAYRFGDESFLSPAGFAFPEPFVALTSAGAGEGMKHPTAWGEMTMFDAYWHVLAPYVVEGEGIGALEDVFYSAADTSAKEGRQRLAEKFRANDGWWDVRDVDEENPIPPTSFRYCSSMMVDADVFVPNGPVALDAPWDMKVYDTHARAIALSSVRYPSQKVVFFAWEAFHNDDLELWCEPGARSAYTMADGSVRTNPMHDEGVRAVPPDRAGPMRKIRVRTGTNAGQEFPAYAWITHDGARGRDVGGFRAP